MKLRNASIVGLYLIIGLTALHQLIGGFIEHAPAWYGRVGVPFVYACLVIGLVITLQRQPTMERVGYFLFGVTNTCFAPFFVGWLAFGGGPDVYSPSEVQGFLAAVMLIATSVLIVALFVGIRKPTPNPWREFAIKPSDGAPRPME